MRSQRTREVSGRRSQRSWEVCGSAQPDRPDGRRRPGRPPDGHTSPVIFADELAAALLGEQADELISYHRAHGSHLVLSCARAQVLCRSRFTEDHLAAASAAASPST